MGEVERGKHFLSFGIKRLEIPNDEGTNATLIASAAAVVWLDVP